MEAITEATQAVSISEILDADSVMDNLEVKKNFYHNQREIDFRQSAPILEYDPIFEGGKQANGRFHATCRDAEGKTFDLNAYGFSNLTRAFGIQGTQAMRAIPDYLNNTIKSIAHNRNIDNAYVVGNTNHVFTRDLAGVQTAAGLMDIYPRRKFSDVKSTSLTLNRETFTPTGHKDDTHFIDAISTISVAFSGVQFSIGTDILRQICTNGMTSIIASSNKKSHYADSWLAEAVDKTVIKSHEMKNAVDAMCTAKVIDTEKTFDYINAGGLPEWVGITAKTLFDLQGRGDLTAKEQAKLCPFGIETLWDFLNTYTWAMHRINDLASKQRLQERLYNFTFRQEFVKTLTDNKCIAI